jgi:uncharacterized phage-associated protein
MTRRKATVYPTKVNSDKVIECILLILKEAEARSLRVTTYDIVKTLFLADRSHMNKYGRPVTFDNYFAMKDGPVPSWSYDLLKKQKGCSSNSRRLPWQKRPAPEFGARASEFFAPERDPNTDLLSVSDEEILIWALQTVKDLGFSQVRRLTHDDAAYLDAWEEDGPDSSAYPMSNTLLFDSPNEEKAKELSFISKHI